MSSFRALVLEQTDDRVQAHVRDLDESLLPDGDVTVDVEWSSLNYKDGMILKGQGRLVRTYPHVPGVDLAGTVSASSDARFKQGDHVTLNGWRVGETWWGGYSSLARVKGDWLVKLPDGITTRRAAAIGTAGYTSMLAVLALEDHGVRGDGAPVVVTGASGGVGSVAVHLLARRGHQSVASTGRREHEGFLRSLGASDVIDRAELSTAPDRPLLSERWGGAVDAVGGDTLAHVLTEIRYGGSVAACGLAGGNQLNTTVIPFLLRGVNLLGIDSVMCPSGPRTRAWNELAGTLDMQVLDSLTTEVGLDELPKLAGEILNGQVRGRVVVRCR